MKIRNIARRWWPVGVGAAVGLAVALVIVAITPKVYTATTTLFVGSAISPDSSVAYNLDLFSQQRALTYSKLAQSREIAVKVQQDLGENIAPDELLAKVSATPVLKTVLMNITATDQSPQHATDIVNTFAAEFSAYVARLETPKGADEPGTAVTVIQRAEPPTSPTSPNTLLNILAGLAGGLVLGFLAKWLLRILDRRVRTSKQVTSSTGLNVLGVLPKDSARRSIRMSLKADGSSAYADAIRKLRTNLVYADVDSPPKTVALISPTSTMATTAITANLAVILDGGDRRVALVDGDVREPRLVKYVGNTSEKEAPVGGRRRGTGAALDGNASGGRATSRLAGTSIDMLSQLPSNRSGETLSSDALEKLFNEFKNGYDFLLCDTPGLLTAADAAEIGRACDGVILVAVHGKTKIEQLTETAETLRRVGANLIGAVLTDAR